MQKLLKHVWHSNVWVCSLLFLVVVSLYVPLFFYSLHQAQLHGTTVLNFTTGDGGDAYEYYALGHTMIDTFRFAIEPASPPEFFRTPGYPLFIVSMIALFHTDTAVELGQIVLVAFSAVLVFLIGTRVASRAVGLVAAGLFFLSPMTIFQSFMTLTETFFVFVLLFGVYTIVCTKRLGLWALVCSGALFGFLVLVRPIALFVLPLLVVWIAVEERHNWKVIPKSVGLFIVGVALLLLPWMARNYILAGHFSVSTIGTYNLLYYNVVEFEHKRTGVSKDSLLAQMHARLGVGSGEFFTARSFVHSDGQKKLITEYLSSHFLQYMTFHAYSTVPFFLGSDIETTLRNLYGHGVLSGVVPHDVNLSALLAQGRIKESLSVLRANPWGMLERFGWLLLLIGGAGFVVHAFWIRSPDRFLIAMLFLLPLLLGVLTGPVAYPRYRMPATPFLLIIGLAGLHVALGYVRQWGMKFLPHSNR